MPDPQTAALTSDQMALDRTRLAYERTLLAWIRTATGLITFGFSIHKFFQFQRESGVQPRPSLIGPREFAIGAMALGLVALMMATLEHRANIRMLPKTPSTRRLSLAGVFAALLSILGLFGLVTAVFRL